MSQSAAIPVEPASSRSAPTVDRSPRPATAPATVVEAIDVVKRFRRGGRFRWPWSKDDERQFLAVNHVSFQIREGETIGLVGESGSGKTTLGKAILKLHTIEGGKILLDGEDIHRMDSGTLQKLRPRYQMIFQNPHSSLNPGMKVFDTLLETATLHLGLKGSEADQRIAEMLSVVGLTGKESAYPSQLSGGEKRRVGLARVLMLSPRLVVADEPTAGLDASLKAGIVNLMLEARAANMAYLFISHDLHLIRYVANRILVMFRGNLVEVVPQGGFELGLPHHPYTELLLESFHLGGGRVGYLPPSTPSPAENLSLPDGKGCCYYPHCTRARLMGTKAEVCRNTAPSLADSAGAGAVACHFV